MADPFQDRIIMNSRQTTREALRSNLEYISLVDVWHCFFWSLALVVLVFTGAFIGSGAPMPGGGVAQSAWSDAMANTASAQTPIFTNETTAVTNLPTVPAKPVHHTYHVRPGDTLTSIAKHWYGKDDAWTVIYWANKKIIPNPNTIFVGSTFSIPSMPKKLPAPPHFAPILTTAPSSALSSTQTVLPSASAPFTGGILTPSQVGSLWLQAGGPSWAESQAVAIAYCESGDNPQAYNPSGATGIWQILGQVSPGNLTDPYINAVNAVIKFRSGGNTFSAWVCQA